jgi:hypothetical protein
MSDEDAAYAPDEQPLVSPEDKSFIESAGHELNGLKLNPYTPERIWVADAIGLIYGKLSEEAITEFTQHRTYPGMAGDVPIVIWACTLSEEEARCLRSVPQVAMKRAAEFAKKHRMVMPKQKGWWNAYNVFLQIMNEIHDAYGEPDAASTEKKTAT